MALVSAEQDSFRRAGLWAGVTLEPNYCAFSTGFSLHQGFAHCNPFIISTRVKKPPQEWGFPAENTCQANQRSCGLNHFYDRSLPHGGLAHCLRNSGLYLRVSGERCITTWRTFSKTLFHEYSILCPSLQLLLKKKGRL